MTQSTDKQLEPAVHTQVGTWPLASPAPKPLEPTIEILRSEYEELLEDQKFLRCLSDVGVDSWEGYDEALRIFCEHEV